MENLAETEPALDVAVRRGLAATAAAQLVGGLGLAAGLAVGTLIVADSLALPALAGLPFAASSIGTATVALPLFLFMKRAGRRRGLRLVWTAAAVGAAAVVVATAARSLPVLLVGMALFGCGFAASDASRYVGSDLALRRGSAVGWVVSVSALTAIVGPNLLAPADDLGVYLGMPNHAGPFFFSALTFLGAAIILDRYLRPDPLEIHARVAAETAADAPDERPVAEGGRIPRVDGARSGVLLGLAAIGAVNLAMVAAMTGVSAGLDRAGHDLRTIGLVLSVFVGSMFVPSPLAGWLSDRIGAKPIVASGGALVLVSSAFLGASASGTSGPIDLGVLGTGLILLGAGWNFGYVSGSALLGAGAGLIRIQGAGEAIRGGAAIAGAILSSMMLPSSGMAGLGLIVSVSGVVLLGAIAANRPFQWRRSARHAPTGSRLSPADGRRQS